MQVHFSSRLRGIAGSCWQRTRHHSHRTAAARQHSQQLHEPQKGHQAQHPAQSTTGPSSSSGSSSSSHKQLSRFYAPQLPPAAGMSVELEPEEAKHAVRVLRLQPGDPVELCDGRGGLVQCTVGATSKSSATLVASTEPQQQQPWRGPQWVLAAACLTLKGGRSDWLVEKATELGAHSLLPLITERSQTGTSKDRFKALTSKAAGGSSQNKRQRHHENDTSSYNSSSSSTYSSGSSDSSGGEQQATSRLERVALAATKQSLRVHGLQVLPAQTLQQLLPQLQAAPIGLVASAGAPPILQVLQQQQQQQRPPPQQQEVQQQQGSRQSKHPWEAQPCYLLIGPEGDFTPQELQDLAAAGVLPVGLGPHRLRTETAAIAALSAAVLVADSCSGSSSS